MQRPIRAVVFDMDGLMLDTESIYKVAWQAASADLGYDLDDEHARPLYPALSALEMEQAIEARLPFNIGYGAMDFKRVRGTTPTMEMNAFYIRHLPMVKKSLWRSTISAIGSLAGPIMKRL